jgi:Bacterial Ig-like domain (group 2)
LENNIIKIKDMKSLKFIYTLRISLLSMIAIINTSCERELSDDATNATFPKVAEVFIEDVVAMGSNFYFPYGGSKPTAWSVDRKEGYNSNVSMRFDVPNANDTEGNYAGAIFRVDGAGRNLTEYDALTFYVKASQGVTISEFGFGEDFDQNKYMATITNVSVGTNWQKVIIPIPDASKLLQERGMFRYAAGTQGTNGLGYTFWIDDLKFEKLGTIRTVGAAIMNGANASVNTFVSVTSNVTGIISTFNLPNGKNQIVNLSSSYFEFSSSNPAVASVSPSGVVTSLSAGTAIITATIGGVKANGSLTINCAGNFVHAPRPTRNPANVISIFSDTYNNAPVNYYNGYWAPWQTTVSSDFSVNGDNILNYTVFNFVGIEFSSPTVNATSMTHFHMNAFIPGNIAPGRQLRVIVVDFGPNGVFGGGDDTRHSTTFAAPFLVARNWLTITIPFSAMPGLTRRSNLAQIILEGGDNSSIYVDNVYFYN